MKMYKLALLTALSVFLASCGETDQPYGEAWFKDVGPVVNPAFGVDGMVDEPYSKENPIGETGLPKSTKADITATYEQVVSGVSGVDAPTLLAGYYTGGPSVHQVKWLGNGRPAESYSITLYLDGSKAFELYEEYQLEGDNHLSVRAFKGNYRQDGYVLRLTNVRGGDFAKEYKGTLVFNRIVVKPGATYDKPNTPGALELLSPDLTLVELLPASGGGQLQTSWTTLSDEERQNRRRDLFDKGKTLTL